MILRKCSPLLSPSYRYFPFYHFFFPSTIYLIHPWFSGDLSMKCARNSFLAPSFPARCVLLISSLLLLSADFHRLWVNEQVEHPEDAVKLLRGTMRFTGSSTHGLSYRSVLSVESRGLSVRKLLTAHLGWKWDLMLRLCHKKSKESRQWLRERKNEPKHHKQQEPALI